MSMDINIGRVVGDKGDTGTTFTPAVSEEGIISWTNDGGKPNPEPRDIKGGKGDTGNGITSIELYSTSGREKTYRITFTNGNHFDYVVTDGQTGATGNGIASIELYSTSGLNKTYRITFTNGDHFDYVVSDGADGQDYVLTTADKEEIAGLVEDMLDVTVTGTTPTITAEENYRYLCGEVSTMSFTPSAEGACDVRFTSGTTPAVLTLPNTVKMPVWFPQTLEASTIYEIMIVDGVYGSVMSWQA